VVAVAPPDDVANMDKERTRAGINAQTAKIPWRDLQRFFAAGKVLLVATELDLVDVAHALRDDQVKRVESWSGRGWISPVNSSQAKDWIANDASLWAVVVKPWVLVQAIADNTAKTSE